MVLYCGGRRVGLLGVVSLEECVQTLVKEKMEAQGVQVCEGWEGRRRWRHRECRCVRGGREGEEWKGGTEDGGV